MVVGSIEPKFGLVWGESAMFRIKVCGITGAEDAAMSAAAGADALGLNFYAGSPRYVGSQLAEAIVSSLPSGVLKVGLFVNAPVERVCATFDQLGLDLIQLHGDEPPEYLAALEGRPVVRAFRVRCGELPEVANYLRRCRQMGCLPRLCLMDSYQTGRYGGTGSTAAWEELRRYPDEDWNPPMVLAGGLTAENVAEAVRVVQPHAVDVASGVESSPGRKDARLVARFVEAAKRALEKVV
jgi:phosphoribosylanthranilate isomerase